MDFLRRGISLHWEHKRQEYLQIKLATHYHWQMATPTLAGGGTLCLQSNRAGRWRMAFRQFAVRVRYVLVILKTAKDFKSFICHLSKILGLQETFNQLQKQESFCKMVISKPQQHRCNTESYLFTLQLQKFTDAKGRKEAGDTARDQNSDGFFS